MDRHPDPVGSPFPLLSVNGESVMAVAGADVGRNREDLRRRRLLRIAVWVGLPALFLWWRIALGKPVNLLRMPHIDLMLWLPVIFFVVLILSVILPFVIVGRSPHVLYRPDQIDVRLNDVVGIDGVKDEVIRSLNLFLAHSTYAKTMGGTPRRGLLFEGPPGTGQTPTAKAMAAAAGVAFLFVSGASFQSFMQGASAMKIRNFFKKMRKIALAEGGAIAFIEEIDAIGGSRRGLAMTTSPELMGSVGNAATVRSRFGSSEGTAGVVNELLVQMQSFDQLTGWQKVQGKFIDAINLLLPLHRQIPKPIPPKPNVLIIAATNRADSLDPALIRPGRFDRTLTFERPDQTGRQALFDFFLNRKAHHDELDDDDTRRALAAVTQQFTPAMIEHLLDEALVNAIRRDDVKLNRKGIEQARLVIEVGLGQPVTYTEKEKRLIATHEAGHATAAYLVAPERRLDVLSIIKRREALGMLAHGDMDEVFTRSRTELLALIQIAMAGQCAEELFFGDVSTGPSGDLAYATNVAAQMVGAAGMTGTLVSFAAVQAGTFNDTNPVGRALRAGGPPRRAGTFNDTTLVGRVLGDGDPRRRVEELLQEQKTIIRAKLDDNKHLIAALRDALVERHELVGREIEAVLESAGGPV